MQLLHTVHMDCLTGVQTIGWKNLMLIPLRIPSEYEIEKIVPFYMTSQITYNQYD